MKKQVVWIYCFIILFSSIAFASPGVDAYKKKDYKKAFELLKIQASQDDLQAMHYIAKMYSKGYFVAKDMSTAVMWWQRAAHGGYPSSMYAMGWAYKFGKGVKKDYETAMKWYLLGAKKGNKACMSSIGNMYKKGQGVPKNLNTAMNWYQKGAKAGSGQCMFSIGYMYGNGQGVTKDNEKAVDWYSRAADKGHKMALNNLGVHFQKGLGIKKDETKAYMYYLLAANKGLELGKKNRDIFKNFLSAQQIAEAKKMANNYVTSKNKQGPKKPIVKKGKQQPKKPIAQKTNQPPKKAIAKKPSPAKKKTVAIPGGNGCFKTAGALEDCTSSCARTEVEYKNITEAEKKIRVALCQEGCKESKAAMPRAYVSAQKFEGKDNYCWHLKQAYKTIVDTDPYSIARKRNIPESQRRSYYFGWGRYYRKVVPIGR